MCVQNSGGWLPLFASACTDRTVRRPGPLPALRPQGHASVPCPPNGSVSAQQTIALSQALAYWQHHTSDSGQDTVSQARALALARMRGAAGGQGPPADPGRGQHSWPGTVTELLIIIHGAAASESAESEVGA